MTTMYKVFTGSQMGGLLAEIGEDLQIRNGDDEYVDVTETETREKKITCQSCFLKLVCKKGWIVSALCKWH